MEDYPFGRNASLADAKRAERGDGVKVFVVTDGCYFDYHICAVFSTIEKAHEFCGGFEVEDNYLDINEWDLDETNGKVFKRQFWVEIVLATGEFKGKVTESVEEVKIGLRGSSGTYCGDATGYGKSYVSLEHAQKLAVELHHKYLRGELLSPHQELEELATAI